MKYTRQQYTLVGSPQQQKPITVGPEVLLFYVQGLYAEAARDFLRLWLERVSGVKEPYQITDSRNNMALNAEGGMYVIWYEDFLKLLYPMYVGITSRRFSTRFKEHIKSGKIDGNLIEEKRVFASVMQMNLPSAKFLESTLLVAFNFALNKQENDGVRDYLVEETALVQQGQDHFAGILNNCVEYLQNLKNIKVGNISHKDVIN